MELRKAWARKQAGELAKLWIQTALYVAMMGGFAAAVLHMTERPRWPGITVALFFAMLALYSVVIAVQDTRKWRANRDAPLPADAAAVLAEDRVQRTAVLLVIAANVPLAAGIAFLGWRMHEIVFLSWMETALSGAFALLRLQRAEPQPALRTDAGPPQKKFAATVIFLFAFGIFLLLGGLFLGVFFPPTGTVGEGRPLPLGEAVGGILGQPGGLLAFLVMVGAQVIAFRAFLRRGEYRVEEVSDVTAPAYVRLASLLVFTAIGGFAEFFFGGTLAAAAVFVVFRAVFELARQRIEAEQLLAKSNVTSTA